MSDWKQTGQWAPPESSNGYWDDESGAPTLSNFANALQVWAVLQYRTDKPNATVAEAALAFNLPPARIYEAIEEHYWMFLSGTGADPTTDEIEHEGE